VRNVAEEACDDGNDDSELDGCRNCQVLYIFFVSNVLCAYVRVLLLLNIPTYDSVERQFVDSPFVSIACLLLTSKSL